MKGQKAFLVAHITFYYRVPTDDGCNYRLLVYTHILKNQIINYLTEFLKLICDRGLWNVFGWVRNHVDTVGTFATACHMSVR